jgi:hypothetical protein
MAGWVAESGSTDGRGHLFIGVTGWRVLDCPHCGNALPTEVVDAWDAKGLIPKPKTVPKPGLDPWRDEEGDCAAP